MTMPQPITMMSPKILRDPTEGPFWKIVLRTIGFKDPLIGLAGGLVAGAIAFLTSGLKPEPFYFFGVVAISVGLGMTAYNRGRSMQSEIQSGEYGEIVRTVDSGVRNLLLVYHVATLVSLIAALTSVLAAIIIGGLDTRLRQAILIAAVAVFFFWSAAGFLSIMRIESAISEHANRVQAAKEEAARAARLKQPDD